MSDHLPEKLPDDTPEAHRLRFEAVTRQLLNTPKPPKPPKPEPKPEGSRES